MGTNTGRVRQLNKKGFKERIFDYSFNKEWEFKGDKPAVIDFYADWCQPCKVVAPIIAKLSEEYDGRVDFYKLNTEKDPQVARHFGISSIPTLLFIAPGEQPVMVRGAQPKVMIKRKVDKMLKEPGGGFSLKDLFSFNRK